jgi:hypothetical protein
MKLMYNIVSCVATVQYSKMCFRVKPQHNAEVQLVRPHFKKRHCLHRIWILEVSILIRVYLINISVHRIEMLCLKYIPHSVFIAVSSDDQLR